ncbi:hypothetical protein [Arcticibacter sp. MXS-1]|uniref:hypothetical protein n=1 Tax=Arcticibacter sp. MXS-1 TaxID=3341726 RepID=UPI0035A8D959
MKKLALLIVTVFASLVVRAQYSKEFITGEGSKSYYVGSLKAINDVNNYDKLKIDILGGAWYSSNIGEVSFYVASRDALKINKTVSATGNGGMFTVKIYQNGTALDVYVVTTQNWVAFAVKSCKLGESNSITEYR